MAPLPKRKQSSSRSRRRRSQDGLSLPNISECSNCHNYKLPHHACPTCGYYNDKPAITSKEIKKNTTAE